MMKPIEFTNAFYIKLGWKGIWEESSINNNIMRIGWRGIPVDWINKEKWDVIEAKIRKGQLNKSAATRDINSLGYIVESTPEDVWITFSSSYLWWCRLGERKIYQDEISKYRKVKGKWHNNDIDGKPLFLNRIPGSIAKTQRFAGTSCHVWEVETLKRLINNQPSEEYLKIADSKEALIKSVQDALNLLHWKDFETLTDLIFRSTGWRRTGVVGESMKYSDIELEDPITGDTYAVQVKSTATIEDLKRYKKGFSGRGFRKLYFVVHSPRGESEDWEAEIDENLELLLPHRIAQMVVDTGLVNWLMNKVK